MSAEYELVRLATGTFSIRSLADVETFHPVEGPIAEAKALYVEQLRLAESVGAAHGEFIIWDVGLGGGGNVLTAINALSKVNASVRIVSFDRTLEALRFALEHAGELQFPAGFERETRELLERQRTEWSRDSLRVLWEAQIGDFPTRIRNAAAECDLLSPHAIFFDAYSPARNPEMWTLRLFESLFHCLDPKRACSLATFSRSTMVRTAMLLAGFFVGAGDEIAGKEETTVAANRLDLIEKPLSHRWLERARVSQSAAPLLTDTYHRAPLSKETWERLRAHPQFASR